MQVNERRNPYVMLGIPFGGSKDVASYAFARRARGLRRAPNGTELLQDLTWALNQVQEAISDPGTALNILRIPADAGALEPDGEGALRPPAELLPRQTEPSAAARRSLLEAARIEAAHVLMVELAASAHLPSR